MAEHYRKSPGEDYSVLMALRMTPQMDAAIDSYLDKAGKAMYQSKAAFVRDCIFNMLAKNASQDTASTVVGGLRLIVEAANNELLSQDVRNTIASAESSVEFYVKNNSPAKLAETLIKYYEIIEHIDDDFWKNYLKQAMDASPVIQNAIATANAAGYII